VEEELKRVKVIDRRHFTSEGERRELEEDERPSPPSSDPAPAPAPAGHPAAAQGQEAVPDEAFKELALFLVQNALAALGQIPGAAGRKPEVNLDAAATMIEWLDSLEKKTRNNLAEEEKQLIGGYLYQLKMLYVKAKQGGKP